MANEITVRSQISVTPSAFKYDSGAIVVDQVASGGPTPGYMTIGTSEESTAFGELSDIGFVLLKNLDDENYVQWGFSTGVYGGRMNPGEVAGPFRMEPAATLYLKANVAACKVLAYGFEA